MINNGGEKKQKVERGTNTFVFDRKNIDEMPKEIQFMMEVAHSIVSNTVGMCKTKKMNPSVLLSAYLEAFKLLLPTMLAMIKEDGHGVTNQFVDGQIQALRMMIATLESKKV